MDWKGHIIFALLCCLVYAYYSNSFDIFFSSLPVIIISSIFPDIDIATSIVRKLLTFLVIIVSILLFIITNSIIMPIVLLLIFFLITLFIPRHRGITHSIVFLFIYSLIIYVIRKEIAIYAFISYLSHLIADFEIKPL